MQQFQPRGFSFLPVVVKNLLIINGIFFLATIVFERTLHTDLIDLLGLHFLPSEKFQPYQIITYMFMHGSFTHILFNMFAVWMFGSALENFWGPKRFLIFYLITGIGAALIHYTIVYFYQIKPVMDIINNFTNDPTNEGLLTFLNSNYFQGSLDGIPEKFQIFRTHYNSLLVSNPTEAMSLAVEFMSSYKEAFLNAPVIVGASGALFGLLLAFGMMFPNSIIYIYFAIPLKAKYFVMIYGLIELVSGVYNSSSDNIAHFAHLGGMLFGFILIKLWKIKRIN
jgi:membrane associated rhomboid family serine protease